MDVIPRWELLWDTQMKALARRAEDFNLYRLCPLDRCCRAFLCSINCSKALILWIHKFLTPGRDTSGKKHFPFLCCTPFSPVTLYPPSDSDGNQASTLRLQESDPAPLLTFLPGHGATQWQHVSLGLRAARTFPEQGVL